MKRFLWIVALLPLALLANEEAAKEATSNDFFPRVVNFLIFAGIIYYLLADKTREFFEGRQNKIASRLEEIQQKLKESKQAKEDAIAKVEEAKGSAEIILQTAKKEIENYKTKATEDLKRELENLEVSYKDKEELEKKRLIREVVSEIIEELFEREEDILKKDDLIDILNKKVA